MDNSGSTENTDSQDTTDAPKTEDSGATEGEQTEVFGGDNDPMKEAKKLSVAEGFLNKALKSGKPQEAVAGVTTKYLLWDAKNALEESRKEGSHTNKMLKVWTALNEEGKAAFINKDAGLMGLIKELANKSIPAAALANLQVRATKWLAVKLLPEDWVGMDMFSTGDVREKVSLGVLPCDEATAKTADSMSSREGKATATITKVIAKFEPELEPVAKVAGIAATVQGNVEKMLPAVRAEIRAEAKNYENKLKEDEMAVTKTQEAERNEIRGLEPPKLLNEMPVNVAVGEAPATTPPVDANNNENVANKAA